MGFPSVAAFSRFPHTFVNARGDALQIVPLDIDGADRLLAMYLAYQPRASFQGLPPLKDEACIRWVQDLIRDGINLVAVRDPDAVGHVALLPIDRERCELLVVVSPRYQDLGVGTELVLCAMQVARDGGLDHIRLQVETRNARARHIYRKCGFGYRTSYDRGEIDMVLDLSLWRGEILIPRWFPSSF